MKQGAPETYKSGIYIAIFKKENAVLPSPIQPSLTHSSVQQSNLDRFSSPSASRPPPPSPLFSTPPSPSVSSAENNPSPTMNDLMTSFLDDWRKHLNLESKADEASAEMRQSSILKLYLLMQSSQIPEPTQYRDRLLTLEHFIFGDKKILPHFNKSPAYLAVISLFVDAKYVNHNSKNDGDKVNRS